MTDLDRSGGGERRVPRLVVALSLVCGVAGAAGKALAATGVEVAAGPTLELPLAGFACSGAGYGGELRAGGGVGPLIVGGRLGILGWGAPTVCYTTFGQSRANDGVMLAGSWGLSLQAFAGVPLVWREHLSVALIGALGARRMTYDFAPAIQPVAIRWLPEVQVAGRLAYGFAGSWTVGAALGLTGLADLDRGPNSDLGPPLARFGLAADAVAFASAAF